MTNEEYDKRLEEINRIAEVSKRDLIIKYCNENAKYNIGDIVTDRIGSVLVKKIKAYQGLSHYPDPVYDGIEVKKDGAPKKKLTERRVYQSNII